MRHINVETTQGIKKEEVFDIYDFPYQDLRFAPICTDKKGTYYNIPATFDIESTTIEPPKVSDKYVVSPYAFMYHWQFCILDKVVFGRTWEEFQKFLQKVRYAMKLSKNCKLAIYVHFLSYEFQFMKEFIYIDNIFAKDKHKVMKANTRDGFEFRCSYFLSNMGLAKFCENTNNVIHYKLTDQYDYSKIRTPKTEMNEIEYGYCFNDVKGLHECIAELLKVDTIATIPLTNTGYVRREFREAVKKNKQNHKNFKKTQLSQEEYKMLVRAFRGGDTHANRYMVNVIHKDVHSFDISSSYPACMLMDDYPIGKFTECTIDSDEKLEYYMTNFCCVFDVTFYNIYADKSNVIPYIDIAHCTERSKIINDNGRVLKADAISLTCTNIDLQIILDTYNIDGGYEITKSIYAEKGKLPLEFREKVMEYFIIKTQLKGIEDKEYEYMKSKNRLNSSYGMSVTSILHNDITYDINSMEWDEIYGDIETALEKFYKSRNNFLSYQWGVFVTANARKRLRHMLTIVGQDVLYTDTDSIKFINEKHIKEFEEMNKQLIYEAEHNDIKAFSDRDGERFHLGTWDNDGEYIRFKTLGSKKYCYEKYVKLNKKGKVTKTSNIKIQKFEITVSGMGKKKGAKQVGKIENFIIGKQFSNIGRTISWYNDTKKKTITINGDTFLTASNIGVLETTYELGVTNEFWDIISNNKNDSY